MHIHKEADPDEMEAAVHQLSNVTRPVPTVWSCLLGRLPGHQMSRSPDRQWSIVYLPVTLDTCT